MTKAERIAMYRSIELTPIQYDDAPTTTSPEGILTPIGRHETGLLFARSFSATTRHLHHPGSDKTLCGSRVALSEAHIDDSGVWVYKPLDILFMERDDRPIPMCERCARSALKY